MPSKIECVFDRIVSDLNQRGIKTEWYILPAFSGYHTVTKLPVSDVYCMEALLGPSHAKPGYDSYAIVQTFVPNYPSLALILMVERKKTDGSPSSGVILYNPHIDRKFSAVLIYMHRALNDLDPSEQNHSLLVQSFHASITLADLIPASINSSQIISRFKQDGQLAQIAVDYDDPLTIFVSKLMRPLSIFIKDIHHIPRMSTLSDIQIPIKNPNGDCYLISDNSTALDRGFELAIHYFDDHYRKYGYILPA